MNLPDNSRIMAAIRGATVQREPLSPAAAAEMVDVLKVLPFQPTYDRIRAYLAEHKWLSTPTEIYDAIGLTRDGRTAVLRAIGHGGLVVENSRVLDGWSYVPPGEPLPYAALEAAHLRTPGAQKALAAGEPLPPIDAAAIQRALGAPLAPLALPARLPVDADPDAGRQVFETVSAARMAGLPLGKIVEAPEPSPERLRLLEAQLTAARLDTDRARKYHESAAMVYETDLAELHERIATNDLALADIRPALRQMLARVMDAEGWRGVFELALDAAWPHLEIAGVDFPVGTFDGEPPARARLTFNPRPKPAPAPAPPPKRKQPARQPRRARAGDVAVLR